MKMGEAVEHLKHRFSAKVIRKWCERGWIVGAVQAGPAGQWVIPQDGLEQCVAQFTPHRRNKLRAARSLHAVNPQKGID